MCATRRERQPPPHRNTLPPTHSKNSMASYDRMVGRSGGHTADGLGSTRSSGADKFNEAMKGQEGDLGMTGKETLDAMRNVVMHGPTGRAPACRARPRARCGSP